MRLSLAWKGKTQERAVVSMPNSISALPQPSPLPAVSRWEPEPQSSRSADAKVASALLAAVNAYADAHGGGEGHFAVPNAGLHIIRAAHRMDNYYEYQPCLCITLQGAKEIQIGEDLLRYGAMQCMVVGLDLPARGSIVAASPEEPFVGVTIELDLVLIREVMEQLDEAPVPREGDYRSMFIADISGPIADCVLRMVNLTGTRKGIEVLYRAAVREFYYWLLIGPNGADLRQQALPDTHLQRIAKAIHLLRQSYMEPIPAERLAEAARMSLSSFHHHFKTLTAMTPLQFQKQLRLLEARRLLLSESMSVAEAAYQVGYESSSQFSREYSRAFGSPPKRDVMSLRPTPA
jgi:AraC-like DNA-binding protein